MPTPCKPALVALALVVAGCAEPAPPPAPRAPAPPEIETVRGGWSEGDATSEWTARFEDGVLVRIEETRDFGEYGDGEAVYTFREGLLARVEQVERTVALELDGTARWDTTRTVVEVAADTVAAVEHTGGLELETDAAARALQYARELQESVYAAQEEQRAATARS